MRMLACRLYEEPEFCVGVDMQRPASWTKKVSQPRMAHMFVRNTDVKYTMVFQALPVRFRYIVVYLILIPLALFRFLYSVSVSS